MISSLPVEWSDGLQHGVITWWDESSESSSTEDGYIQVSFQQALLKSIRCTMLYCALTLIPPSVLCCGVRVKSLCLLNLPIKPADTSLATTRMTPSHLCMPMKRWSWRGTLWKSLRSQRGMKSLAPRSAIALLLFNYKFHDYCMWLYKVYSKCVYCF